VRIVRHTPERQGDTRHVASEVGTSMTEYEHEPVVWKLDTDGTLALEQYEAGLMLVITLSADETRRLYDYLSRSVGQGSPA
jgi:hypothetical protein